MADAKTTRFKAIVIDDDDQVRKMLVECLEFLGFYCVGYREAEAVLDLLSDRPSQMVPDLFVIDLELGAGRLQGLNLIEMLTGHDLPSTIIAMSAGLSNAELIEALKAGAHDVIAKPFDVFQFADRMRRLADIGRNRIIFRLTHLHANGSGPQSLDRPVFLSYTFRDKRTASILTRQLESRGIGVSYFSDNEPKELRVRIDTALESAQVLVPLLTDNYPRSSWCVFEMSRSRHPRIPGLPVIFPVLEGVLDRIRNRELLNLDGYEYVDITFDRFADGLTTLIGRIQRILNHR